MFIERKLRLERIRTPEYRGSNRFSGHSHFIKLHGFIIGTVIRDRIGLRGRAWLFALPDPIDKYNLPCDIGDNIAFHVQYLLPECRTRSLYGIDRWLVKNIIAIYEDKRNWESRSPEEREMIAKTLKRMGRTTGTS